MSVDEPETHPSPRPNSLQRKVELHSTKDLIFLQDKLAQSALAKLDLHFPHISKPATHISLGGPQTDKGSSKPGETQAGEEEEQEDEFRKRVRGLVSEFLTQTWTSAQCNVTLNGIDGTSLPVPHTATLSDPPPASDASTQPAKPEEEREGVDFRYASFDANLQQQVASLYGELEKLTAKVSALRRTAPKQSAEQYRNLLDARLEMEDKQNDRALSPVPDADQDVLKLDAVPPGWNEDVRQVYEHGLTELASLAGSGERKGHGASVTETMGKLQRARDVAMEME